MYDRAAPTRNRHDLQWPKLRRTQLFLHQSLAKIDVIEHLQSEAQDVKEAHRVELKQVSHVFYLCSILTVI